MLGDGIIQVQFNGSWHIFTPQDDMTPIESVGICHMLLSRYPDLIIKYGCERHFTAIPERLEP